MSTFRFRPKLVRLVRGMSSALFECGTIAEVIGVGQGLARAGIYPLRASGEGFGDKRLPDTAIGPRSPELPCLRFS